MATHSNILAWEIPWTKEPGRLHLQGCKRVGHNLATKQQQGREIMSCSIYSEKCETQSDNSL